MALEVLALRPLGLGDLLTAVPALRALRKSGAAVTVAAPAVLAPLVRLAGCDLIAAAPLQPLPREAHGADLLVNLHGRGPHSHAIALAARPRRLLAFAHPDVPATAAMPTHIADEHEVVRWCRLLSDAAIRADPTQLDLPAPPLPSVLAETRGATVVHPGAADAARRWPAERFATVAAAEYAAGRRIAITGTGRERPLALSVAQRARLPASVVLAGRTDLVRLAAVIAHAGRVICGDTGVAHLATAFGVPSVLIFGPTSPSAWGPPPARARHRVLWAGVTGDPHADRPHDGLLAIEPADVLAELAALPSADDGARLA
ncbi:MAG TPA: glycosyltransferase family 9 protein [Baekduia sp.]|uniref:glycosyltransferase family 9 protein n=1 Tax=Baekduia sp. TaxID=2600305 RepID=UPI002C3C5EEA|nr:glycosyltransferase family 9 protein [Baekduia sp.]HMJ35057.1 glycosyltransferase family 9 protein [Baekduia sp.]